MLPKINRLKKKKDFESVFKKRKKTGKDLLLLRFAENGLGVSRFGFVVGRAVSKKAVARNKIKRRLREIIKKKLPKIKPGFDMVWLALPGAGLENFRETGDMVDKILKKAELIKQ